MKHFINSAFVFSMFLISCNDNSPEPTEDRIGTDKKLASYVDAYTTSGTDFEPQVKVEYTYNDSDKLSRYTVLGYNTEDQAFYTLNFFNFTYSEGLVSSIQGFLVDATEPNVEYNYVYAEDSSLVSIQELNHSADVNSTATFSYSTNADTVTVAYVYSNGTSFDYLFVVINGNITQDITTNGTEVCSKGSYTYDDHINPFNRLGYVEYSLRNFYKNNRLTEMVDFQNCAFPELMPETFEYEYDEDGYPTSVEISYRGLNQWRLQRTFTYLD